MCCYSLGLWGYGGAKIWLGRSKWLDMPFAMDCLWFCLFRALMFFLLFSLWSIFCWNCGAAYQQGWQGNVREVPLESHLWNQVSARRWGSACRWYKPQPCHQGLGGCHRCRQLPYLDFVHSDHGSGRWGQVWLRSFGWHQTLAWGPLPTAGMCSLQNLSAWFLI